MNGVRRFLGSAVSVSNSPPSTASDIPSAIVSSKPSWPPSPIQNRSDSSEDLGAVGHSQPSRKDRQRQIQADEDEPIAMLPQGNRAGNGTTVAPSRLHPSVSSFSSRPFRSSSPISGVSPRVSSQSLHTTRTSVTSQDLREGRTTLRLLNVRDELLISLLASEAVVDSRGYEMLSAEEVDELKKELHVLNSRLEATSKKLILETKIRDAAVSLSKITASHKTVSKQSDDQLEAANRRVDAAQNDLWRVSQRQHEVNRRLLEHRAGVLSFSLRSMEKKIANDADTEDTDTSSLFMGSATSSVFGASVPSKSRFDGAHLFAGHADAQIPTPRRIPGAAEYSALEEKLKAATDALNDASKRQAEMARELSHLRLEKEEAETVLGMDLQSAEDTILALEKELPKIEKLDAQLQDLLQQRTTWEKERTALTEQTRRLELLERQLEQQRIADDSSIRELEDRHRLELERKDADYKRLQLHQDSERRDWERQKAVLEDEKLEDLARLQEEVDSLRREDGLAMEKFRTEIEEASATLRNLMRQHAIALPSRDHSLQSLLSFVVTHVDNVSIRASSHDEAKRDWEALRKKLEDDIRSGLDKREALVREIEDARTEREDARRDLRLLESRIKNQAGIVNTTKPDTMPHAGIAPDIGDHIHVLQSLWSILPSPEARAAKFGTQRQFRTGTPTSPTPSSPKPGSTSLSELDVRSLKLLYDTRTTPSSPSSFSLESFAARVQALVTDDRALIERLIRFAQAHDLLKKNAERAQKLAQDSNMALETYQRQVRTLEDRNLALAAKQIDLQDQVQDLQRAIDRITAQKRDVEMLAAEQAETCRQLSDANNQLSAKTLALANEAASIPEKVRKQMEVQLAECQVSLQRAQDEIDMLRTSEQSQRIALLDELNSMQTENGNLRAQLRAVKK